MRCFNKSISSDGLKCLCYAQIITRNWYSSTNVMITSLLAVAFYFITCNEVSILWKTPHNKNNFVNYNFKSRQQCILLKESKEVLTIICITFITYLLITYLFITYLLITYYFILFIVSRYIVGITRKLTVFISNRKSSLSCLKQSNKFQNLQKP